MAPQHAVKRALRSPQPHPNMASMPRTALGRLHALSARAKETVYAVVVAGNLRVIFVLRGNIVYTLDIGSHALYRT